MADISAFPTIKKVLVSDVGGVVKNMKAAGTIKAGMVVCFADSGVDDSVIAGLPSVGMIAGVAAYDASSGDALTVYGNGCKVYVAQADDTATIDAGHFVAVNDNAVGGTVSELDPAIGSHAATVGTAAANYLGQLQTDMAAGSTAIVEINIGVIPTASS